LILALANRIFLLAIICVSLFLGLIIMSDISPGCTEVIVLLFVILIYAADNVRVLGKEERSLGEVRFERGTLRVPLAIFDGLRGYKRRLHWFEIDHILVSSQLSYIRGTYGKGTERDRTNVKIVTRQGRTYDLGDRPIEEAIGFTKKMDSIFRIPTLDREKKTLEEMKTPAPDIIIPERTGLHMYLPEILLFSTMVMVFPVYWIRTGNIRILELFFSLCGLPPLFIFLNLRNRIVPRTIRFGMDRFQVSYRFGQDREILYNDVKSVHLVPSSAFQNNWPLGFVTVSSSSKTVPIGYVPAIALAKRLSLV